MKLSRKKNPPIVSRHRPDTRGGRPQAFSYHANRLEQNLNLGRQQPRDQDVRRHERLIRYWRQRIGALIALVVIFACLLNILHLSPTPRVVALTASSNEYFLQDTTVYQQAASKQFASSIFNNNKITINTAAITERLQSEFPELSDVSVTLPLIGHRPIVYIASTTPSLILKTTAGSYILDNNGKALLASDSIADVSKLQLPTVTDQSNLAVKLDTVTLPSTSVSFIQTIVQQLKAKGVPTDTFTLAAAAYEFDVKPSGVGYYVKFNMHSDTAQQQAGTFLAVKQRLASQGITPSSYLDVRVDGRAYYK